MNGSCQLDPANLEFPVEVQFRVIAEAHEKMAFVIETVLMELGVDAPVRSGNRSKSGTYRSYSITTVVESREMMNRIDAELRAIAGVKMVL
jgi:putative lipoic acid-binding regulatory protein